MYITQIRNEAVRKLVVKKKKLLMFRATYIRHNATLILLL